MTDSAARTLPPIIDVHAHPPMPSFLAALRRNDAGGRPWIAHAGLMLDDWTSEQGLELMDAHGVAAMMMSNPLGTGGERGAAAVALARHVNDEMAAVIARHPRRFGAFAMLPLQDVDASLAEMTRALDELGFDGVCLLTNVDGVYPGDPRFEPILAELNRRRGVAFVHPIAPPYLAHLALRFDPSLMEFMIDSNRAVASLVLSGMRAKYSDFTYIATHGGGTTPYLVHRFETGRLATAAYGVEMAPEAIRAGFRSIDYELTAATGAEQIAAVLELTDTSRLMLGFDYPIRPTRLIDPSRAELAASRFLGDGDLEAIARGNALRLLPGLAGRLTKGST